MAGFLQRFMAPRPAPSVLPPVQPYADRWWRSSDGLRLYARDYAGAQGEAKAPVICLHGLTRNAADFEDLAPWIAAQGRRVLAVDVRGRGKSAWDPQPMRYHPGVYTTDVIEMMGKAGISRAVFIGTSMGGIIAMVLASLRPDLIEAAVLNDIGPRIAAAGLARIGGYVGGIEPVKTWDQAAAYAKAQNGHAFPDYGDADWLAFARRLFETAPDGTLRLAYDPAIAEPFKITQGAPAGDMTPWFLALMSGRRSLLIHGETSDILDQATASDMRRMVPGMDYAEVLGVGHAPTLSETSARDAIGRLLDAAG